METHIKMTEIQKDIFAASEADEMKKENLQFALDMYTYSNEDQDFIDS
jgi:hypothetical protein